MQLRDRLKALVDQLWNYSDVLRDDGLSYGDYVEQLTYLLFLKMSDEQQQLGLARIVPEGYDWSSLPKLSGAALEAHYIEILNTLGTTDDMLGVVFRKAQNRIQDPAKLQPSARVHSLGGRSPRTPPGCVR